MKTQPRSLKSAVGDTDALIHFGQELKAKAEDPYKFERAYLVLFTGPEDPDLAGDYFDAKTDFGSHTKTDMYYDHGLDDTVGKEVVGTAEMGVDAKGVWLDAQLDRANKYAKDIAKLGKAKKLGLSSGTASHLVAREPITDAAGKTIANHITKWPLGLDASFTPTPCEPKTRPDIMPIKAYVHQSFKALTEGMEGDLDESSALTNTDLGTYTYPVAPTLGHTMSSKMATEHGRLVHQLYRNRTISTPDYKHISDGFANCVRTFHTGLNEDMAGRTCDQWDDYDAQYKAMGPGMKTVGDALHGAITRAYNAGADHMMTRGYMTTQEHKDAGDHFAKCRDEYMGGIDDSVKNRTLKENGTSYADIKSLDSAEGHGPTLESQVGTLLADISIIQGKALPLKDRFESVKSVRAEKGRGLGPKACGHIEETANALKALALELEAFLPVKEVDSSSRIAELKKFREQIAN